MTASARPRPGRPTAALKGCAVALTVALSTTVLFALMLPLALVKLVLPLAAVRRALDPLINGLATTWIAINNRWIALVGGTRWDVRGLDGLDARGWYLVASNHQSWVDILVLQKVFTRRIPLLKFFLKRELLWVPVIGLAWWALDFPFLHRRGGAAGRDDLDRTRRACEKFRHVPTSVINFVEGTRFTRARHDAQRSPFRHLLKPKAGGLAIALATLGDRFEALLDVSIVYPDGAPTFWQLMTGRMTRVIVDVRRHAIPPQFARADTPGDAQARASLQDWLNELWRQKDALIDSLQPKAAAGA